MFLAQKLKFDLKRERTLLTIQLVPCRQIAKLQISQTEEEKSVFNAGGTNTSQQQTNTFYITDNGKGDVTAGPGKSQGSKKGALTSSFYTLKVHILTCRPTEDTAAHN